jgi:hypothetical protein
MKGSDGVLGLAEVYACFATDGGVDHREQGCRHGDPSNASQQGCRCETCDIRHDASAERDDNGLSIGARVHKRGQDSLDGRELLVRFACLEDDRRLNSKSGCS